MPFIALVGPHAVGKTTAAKRWAAHYQQLHVYYCDNQKPPESSSEIVLLEGCSAMANRWLPQLAIQEVIHCYCTPEMLEANMRARCASKNKKYREDYWTLRWLEYESRSRMDNLLSKRMPMTLSKSFLIQDRERDWPIVDTYFSSLYRRLHNQCLRLQS